MVAGGWPAAALALRPDLNDIIAEVSPIAGTLLAFKRTDNSWHGHEAL